MEIRLTAIENISEVLHLEHTFVFGLFGNQIRSTWKVLKCGVGEDGEDKLDRPRK
jgi:hypothetical protein